MAQFGRMVLRILNLHDLDRPRMSTPRPRPSLPQAGGPGATPAAQPRENPWVTASKRLQAMDAASAAATAQREQEPAAPESHLPWQYQEEGSFGRVAARAGRGLLWGVVVLATITGLRTWIWPEHPPAPAPAPVKNGPEYPVQAAQQVAARWARSYLTWDEKDPQSRAKVLAMDMPQGSDTALGWDGHGQEDVAAVQPGAVTVLSGHRARVRIDALVTSAKSPQHWVGLDVPVLETAGRIVVTGEPGIVGLPVAGPTVPSQQVADGDAGFSVQTQQVVEGFFTAYANGDANSVTAPGASIDPLPAGMSLVGVQNWTADAGSGDDRTGTAVVKWSVSGAQIEQTYRVELTRVSSASAQRWQVAGLHGGVS